MVLDTTGKRLEAFSRVLKNAGLPEASVSRVIATATAFESSRDWPPANEDEIRIWVREAGLTSPQQGREAEAFLGAYMVFNYPSTGLDAPALIQGVLGFEADKAIAAAQKALEGEGELGGWLTQTIGFFKREAVRRWLAPAATIALVAIAFLENPLVRFYMMILPRQASSVKEADPNDPAVQEAMRDARLALRVARALGRSGGDERESATLEGLVAGVPGDAEVAALIDRYELDPRVLPRRVLEGRAMPSLVIRGKGEGASIIHVGGHIATVVDARFVITVEDSR